MAPKQRNKANQPYPTNWRYRLRGKKHYMTFRVPKSVRHLWDDKAEFTLGIGESRNEAEQKAYKVWADRIAVNDTPHTMGKAFDRYEAEVIPDKAKKSRESNLASLRRLRPVIPGDMPVRLFETHLAFQYRDQCAKKESNKKANLDIELLSHVFTKCFEWGTPGLVEHPLKGKIEKIFIPPRERYPEDWEVDCVLSVANPMLSVYIPLKYALGIDQSLMLGIRMQDIKEDRLVIQKRTKLSKKARAKAKKKEYLFFDRDGGSTGLKELIDDVIAWREKHIKVISGHLFCTRAGHPYIKEDGDTGSFKGMWQRNMRKALEKTELKESFTEHDLCAKTASDVETVEEAAKLRGALKHPHN